MKVIFSFILICLLSFKVFGQKSDSTEKNFRIFPLPVVYYTPETEWGFGAVSLFSFRFKGETKESRTSQFQFGGAYTQRDQVLFYLPFQLYYKNEKYYSFGELGYYKYSYRFFGVGNDLPAENEELYNVNFPRIRLNLMKLARPSWYLGMRYWYDGYDIVKVKEGGLLDTQDITGAEGGTVSSLGLISLYDTRNYYNYPSKGTYLEVLALPNLKTFGSDFEYTRFSIDYVQFLSKNKNILAINLYGVSILGEAPFNELAFIGGRSKMRGYFEGRHRNRNLLMAQAEYRRTLFWKLGMVAFVGYGVVARNIDEYAAENIKPSGGFGLRYRLNEEEKINIRLDFGYGENNNSGVYLTIGEAF